jgi:hypothetical protein
MKKFILVLLLAVFLLPACERKKNDIEGPVPSSPPDLEMMKPTGPPQ